MENGKASMARRNEHSGTTLKQSPLLRQMTPKESVNELLVLLRSQEESPDKTILQETKCLLSLSLDRNSMPPLPSIAEGKNKEKKKRQDITDSKKTSSPTETKQFTESLSSDDDEVSNVSLPQSFSPAASSKLGTVNPRRRLPSLDSRIMIKKQQ